MNILGNDKLLSGVDFDKAKRRKKDMVNTFSKMLNTLGNCYVELYKELVILFKKNIKRFLRSVLIGVGAFALCCGLAIAVIFIMGTYNKYVFSTSNWNTYKSDRINMIDSMESKHNIKGMTQVEVENLLGKPNYETMKEQCEYISLSNVDYDKVAEYELNSKSRSLTDIIEKNYVVAYKNNKAVYADVLIAE